MTQQVSAEAIDEAFVPRRAASVSFVELDDELVLAVERPGTHEFDAHWLDRSASIVWSCFDGVRSLHALIDDLHDAFGTDRDVVRDDVIALTRTLGRAGLLEGVTFEPPQAPTPVRPEGLTVGTPAPILALEDLAGLPVVLDSANGRRQVLVNWSPSCGYCVRIAPDLAALTPDLEATGIDLVLLAAGPAADNRRLLDDTGLACTVLRGDASALFGGSGTPTAYLVDERGLIASDLHIGAAEVPELLRQVAGA